MNPGPQLRDSRTSHRNAGGSNGLSRVGLPLWAGLSTVYCLLSTVYCLLSTTKLDAGLAAQRQWGPGNIFPRQYVARRVGKRSVLTNEDLSDLRQRKLGNLVAQDNVTLGIEYRVRQLCQGGAKQLPQDGTRRVGRHCQHQLLPVFGYLQIGRYGNNVGQQIAQRLFGLVAGLK